MSSFVWMKFLESAPERYDAGIALLSRGRIEGVYEGIAERVAVPGCRILDIGCGTGGVTLACAARGARVVGIDINAGMLEIARRKPVPPAGSVDWLQVGIAEMEDRFAAGSFDAAVACLSVSEWSDDERRYALASAWKLLVPGGQCVIADETVPAQGARRWWHRLSRAPASALTYVVTQVTTHPVEGVERLLRDAGFVAVEESRIWGDTFVIAIGRRPLEGAG